mgnify:CR=1 FL=1
MRLNKNIKVIYRREDLEILYSQYQTEAMSNGFPLDNPVHVTKYPITYSTNGTRIHEAR